MRIEMMTVTELRQRAEAAHYLAIQDVIHGRPWLAEQKKSERYLAEIAARKSAEAK